MRGAGQRGERERQMSKQKYRTKSIEVIKKYTRQGLNEDGYFARAMTEMGANMPSYDEALQFAGIDYLPCPFSSFLTLLPSPLPFLPPVEIENTKEFLVERIFYPTPFGVHRFGYTRFTEEQRAQLLEYCPEINLMTL